MKNPVIRIYLHQASLVEDRPEWDWSLFYDEDIPPVDHLGGEISGIGQFDLDEIFDEIKGFILDRLKEVK